MSHTDSRKHIGDFQGKKTRVGEKFEKSRRKIVSYIFVVYWLLIFEGALRKWAFPQFHEIIFFARDPIVLLIYIVAWRDHLVKWDSLLTTGMVISIIFIILMLIQFITIDINPLTLVYGWRMYFFYLPLAFVIKYTFNHEDINKLIRRTLYVGAPLSLLVYFQYISPPYSFINAGYSTSGVFIVADNIVRTTGTFTFTAGQTMFSASLIAMLVVAWLYRKRSPLLSMPWLVMASGAAIVTLLLTGSRTAFFMVGLIFMATFFGLLFTRSAKIKFTGTMLLVFLLVVGTVLFLGPFKKSFDALGTRFEQAENQEGSAIRRAFAPLIIFTQHVANAPLLGYGLGIGTSGGSLLSTGKMKSVLPEDEWSRITLEVGPLFAFIYLGYRIFFSLKIFGDCIRNARNNNLLPMIFLGFIGFYILAGQITHNGTIQGYNWIFIGLTMAVARKQAQTPELPTKK